jgi:polar amino acid transport system permease protein
MESMLSLLSLGADGWGDELLIGAWVTVRLALATLPFGLVLGLAVALAKNSGQPSLVLAGNIYTTIFRGLPELLTLFLVYYGGQIVIREAANLLRNIAAQVNQFLIVHSFPPVPGLPIETANVNIEVNGFIAGMVALGFVFSAYSSEAFLGAFKAISRGQNEAGHALGLTTWQTFRLIILPQLIRLTLPALSNLWLVLLKETSLVSVIAYDELLRKTFIAVGVTKQPLLFFTVALLIYLVLSLISSTGLDAIDRRVRRGERRVA